MDFALFTQPGHGPCQFQTGHRSDRIRFPNDPNLLRSIELACNKTTIPAENGFGFGDAGDFGEELAAEVLTDIGKCARLESESRTLQGRCARRIRFSAARYSHWRGGAN
jgi:hypothetical protein